MILSVALVVVAVGAWEPEQPTVKPIGVHSPPALPGNVRLWSGREVELRPNADAEATSEAREHGRPLVVIVGSEALRRVPQMRGLHADAIYCLAEPGGCYETGVH